MRKPINERKQDFDHTSLSLSNERLQTKLSLRKSKVDEMLMLKRDRINRLNKDQTYDFKDLRISIEDLNLKSDILLKDFSDSTIKDYIEFLKQLLFDENPSKVKYAVFLIRLALTTQSSSISNKDLINEGLLFRLLQIIEVSLNVKDLSVRVIYIV